MLFCTNIPLALALDPGSQYRSSLGIVIIGGVLSSLVLTLLLIPNVYAWVAPSDEKFRSTLDYKAHADEREPTSALPPTQLPV